jgi:pimeloyl-ACP methyl ester carboxylesterase
MPPRESTCCIWDVDVKRIAGDAPLVELPKPGGVMQAIAGSVDGSVEARGLKFHYLEWGRPEAPPLVALHGLTSHAHTWDHVAKDLADHHRVLVPDQRGHGDTTHTPSYTTSDFVDDLEALRIAWGLERFVLMGLSMGGHNSMAYALAYPERISHLIVVDIPPRLRREMWLQSDQAAEIQRIAREGHRPFASVDAAFAEARKGNTTAPDDKLRYRTELNLLPTDAGLMLKWDPKVQVLWEPADLTEGLLALPMPVLLVRGGKTMVLPRETAEAMVARIPDAELVEVPTSGHSVPTDRPEELTPIVMNWLRERGG